MKPLRRWLLVTCLVILLFLSLPFEFSGGTDILSHVSCNPEHTQCIYQDICLNAEFGLFYISNNESLVLPGALGPATTLDTWKYKLTPFVVQPSKLWRTRVTYLENTALVVAGSFAPFHLSHDIDSSVVPVEALLNRNGLPEPGTDLHLLTIGRFPSHEEGNHMFPISLLGFSRLFGSGVQEVFADVGFERYPIFDGLDASNRNIMRGATFCYPKAVVGLGDVCSHCTNKPTAEDFRTLREKVIRHYNLPREPIKNRVVFLRRLNKRVIVNHDEVVAYLQTLNLDLKVFIPEEHPLEEQIATLAEASVFIAPHGNGNAHFHWMSEKALFVEILSWTGHGYDFFRAPARQKGMRYRQIKCDSKLCESLDTRNPNRDNMDLNVTTLDQVLREEGVIPTTKGKGKA